MLPGAGRGIPVQHKKSNQLNQPNQGKQNAQQKASEKPNQKSIEQQIRDMQPSFDEEASSSSLTSSGSYSNTAQSNMNKKGKKQKQVVMSWG